MLPRLETDLPYKDVIEGSPLGTCLVDVSDIDVPAHMRPLDDAHVTELMKSIADLGLLEPIGVRNRKDKPGRVLLIYGGHRLAAFLALGYVAIEARVLDMDDDEARLAGDVENLHRKDLTAAGKLAAIKRFDAWWNELHPPAERIAKGSKRGGRGRGKQRTAEVRARAEAEHDAKKAAAEAAGRPWGPPQVPGNPPPADAEPDAEPVATHEALARRTKLTASSVKSMNKLARKLTDEELKVFDDRKIGRREIQAYAKIEDAEAKKRVLALVASGMVFDDAMALGTAPAGSKIEEIPITPDDEVNEASLSDADWLDRFCGEVLAKLKYTANYKANALLWRQCRDARNKFKRDTAKFRKAGQGARPGPLFSAYNHAFMVAHPSEWTACGKCGGRGMVGDQGQCSNCNGYAYLIKSGMAK